MLRRNECQNKEFHLFLFRKIISRTHPKHSKLIARGDVALSLHAFD